MNKLCLTVTHHRMCRFLLQPNNPQISRVQKLSVPFHAAAQWIKDSRQVVYWPQGWGKIQEWCKSLLYLNLTKNATTQWPWWSVHENRSLTFVDKTISRGKRVSWKNIEFPHAQQNKYSNVKKNCRSKIMPFELSDHVCQYKKAIRYKRLLHIETLKL